MSAYVLLGKKAFRRNLQYRAAHMVNNVADTIFGLYSLRFGRRLRPARAARHTARRSWRNGSP